MEPDERAWNHALRSWFFRPDLAGRGAYLAVDEETLAAIASERGFHVANPAESLSQAIRHRVSMRTPLSSWIAEANRWRRSGCESDPPFLSILAVTVLAATIVDQVSDRSYYRRLNKLLHLPGTGMPRDFDNDIQQLWTYLNDWLTHKYHDQLGMATATNIGGPSNVGWAQSQILLRTTDRTKLPLFFTELGLQPGQMVDGTLLVRRLRSWSADGRAVSQRLAAVLQDTRLSELLGHALHSELTHWDGTLRDEVGRIKLRLLLAFHERTACLQVASQIPDELSGTTWSLQAPGSGECELELITSDEPQLLTIPFTPSILEGAPLRAKPASALTPRSDEAADGSENSALALALPHRDVYLLCPDDRLARWVQVPTALLNRPHLVLVQSGSVKAATRIMSQLGSRDAQPFRRIHKPAGWEAFKFTPVRYQRISGPLAALSPRGNELSTMEGGLPISKRKRIYLSSGAPDLIRDLHEQTAPVIIDNSGISSHDETRLRLADLGLTAGTHSIDIGGVHYQLTLVAELAEKPFEGVLSFAFKVGSDSRGMIGMWAPDASTSAGHHSPDDATIRGAAISVSPSARQFSTFPHPPHVRAGGTHYVLGRPGEIAKVDMQPPGWVRDLHLNPHLADSEPSLSSVPFTPAWVIRVTGTSDVTVSAVRTDTKPEIQAQDRAASADLWRSVIPHIKTAVAEPADRARWAMWRQDALTYDPTLAAGH